jgi:lysozyme
VDRALAACQQLYPTWATLPEAVQEILANMMFNCGMATLARFVGLRAAVARHDWPSAADAMQDSRWFHQVGARSQRLVAAMHAVGKDARSSA